MTDSRKALKRLRKQANKASLMIDIGPLSDEDWELCATAARATVPRLLDALEKVLNLHFKAQPVPAAFGTQEGGDYCRTCAEDWPCPTVTVITTGIEGIMGGGDRG